MTVFPSQHPISRNFSAVTSIDQNECLGMRYSSNDNISNIMLVKSRFFAFRHRLVRLEHGVLSIFPDSEDYVRPSRTIRINETRGIEVDDVSGFITIRAGRSSKVWATLSFKDQGKAVFSTWADILTRAKRNVLERYYLLCSEIGQGHTATVFEALDKKTKERVAVKAIVKDQADSLQLKNIRREADIVQRISHPNIVKTYDVFETSQVLYIVMEYIKGGTLMSFLAGGKNRINEKNGLRFAKQLFDVVAYLHDMDVIHRDIKPENVLLTSNGILKLMDFGLARFTHGMRLEEYALSSTVGTPAYCPPEIVSKKQYGNPVDLYSCGALLYLTLSGARPVSGATRAEVFDNIKKGVIRFPQHRWSHVSTEGRDLVQRLLSLEPQARPTAKEALRHPWLRTGDKISRVRSALSASPFVRQDSARGLQYRSAGNSGTTSPHFSRTGSGSTSPHFQRTGSESTSPRFQRTGSGSLAELERHKKNLSLVGMLN